LACGAIIVNISFFFVFSECFLCSFVNGDWFRVFYWAFFASTFNIGWAAIQVSHMALVPEITLDESERVRLNSARYASGIIATLLLLGVSWFSIQRFGISQDAFHIIAGTCIVSGDIFTLIFLFGVKESLPQILRDSAVTSHSINLQRELNRKRSTWYSWFAVPMFYQIGIIYMFSRVTVNMSQVLMPFYFEFSFNLEISHPASIAEVPLVVMVTSFITTFCLKRVNKYFGRRTTYAFGAFFACVGLVALYCTPESMWYLVFVIAVFLGIGTTTVLVTSISMEADLIGSAVQSGAFVYGALSFTDKLANGIIIQLISPYSKNPIIVRYLISMVPGFAAVAAVLMSFTVIYYYKSASKRKEEDREALLRRHMPEIIE